VTWRVERAHGSAASFHEREMVDPVERSVWVFTVSRPALVLGSTQALGVVDGAAAAAGRVEVVRRRSGGGAVLLVPGESLWVDVVLPRGDALWDDDVARATHWLGAVWVAALATCGVTGTVHTGGMAHTPWSRLVCFAGVGPGEVLVGGHKAVGISQRRTRVGARFQCVAHRRWPGEELVALLAPPRPTAGELPPVAELAAAPEPLLTAFLSAL
jgi:lipoate-protein ligase A